MTIHSEHPFLEPESDRNPLRRFRGRMPLPVTVWTTGARDAERRTGWTVSSLVVADGEPPQLLGLLDEDSELATAAVEGSRLVINLLRWDHRQLADAFAGTAPAPGGPFRLAEWTETEWGPALNGAAGWLGLRVLDTSARAGWSIVLRGEVERIEVSATADDALGYLRGRYRSWSL